MAHFLAQSYHKQNINEHTYFCPNVLSKRRVVRPINATDILDQFSPADPCGTTTLETMACEKPVLTYYKKDYIISAFDEEAPIPNSFTKDEICSNLLTIVRNADYRTEVQEKSREWIIKTHSSKNVLLRHLEILELSILLSQEPRNILGK